MIDVIVPVYGGLHETRRCLESVLANPQSVPREVVAVDDATPEPPIARYLDELAAAGRISLLRNATNCGFVKTVNRGMGMHPDRDVVLLNSDAEVANDWLDRLHRAACAGPDVGTVTPFSNNATICSYPFEGWAGGTPGTLGLAALDRLFASTNAGQTQDLPTAVGFCMYIRRGCLDQLGLFDADRFGRGYGEENDFCMRAAKAGWRNVVAGDVFVYHEGSVSFSAERFALTETAARALGEAHPDYLSTVRAFAMRDPLRTLRDAVDTARIALGPEEHRHVWTERAAERTLLREQLAQMHSAASANLDVISRLNDGLARAEGLIVERDTAILELHDEIARLRAGLSHAESLAFGRERELERLRRSWLWRCMLHFTREKAEPPPQRRA